MLKTVTHLFLGAEMDEKVRNTCICEYGSRKLSLPYMAGENHRRLIDEKIQRANQAQKAPVRRSGVLDPPHIKENVP